MRSRFIVLLLLVLGTCLCLPVTAVSAEAQAYYTAGRTLADAGNYTEALQAYDLAISISPDYAEAWDGRADVLNRANRHTTDPLSTLTLAINASDRALALNASSPAFWINRGQILYTIGYYYQDELNDKATAEKYYDEQLEAFEKAISLDPGNTEAWFNKAYALCGMGRCTEGVTAFEKVQSLDPEYPNLAANLDLAKKLAAKETPDYSGYIPAIVLIVIAVIGAGLWYRAVKKKY